jgi:hypothetical protein
VSVSEVSHEGLEVVEPLGSVSVLTECEVIDVVPPRLVRVDVPGAVSVVVEESTSTAPAIPTTIIDPTIEATIIERAVPKQVGGNFGCS